VSILPFEDFIAQRQLRYTAKKIQTALHDGLNFGHLHESQKYYPDHCRKMWGKALVNKQ
jgi:hypothetical protein